MFKKTYSELKARREATMTESEYNAQKEIEEMESRLMPKRRQEFGTAIKETTRYFEKGIDDL